MVNFSEKPWSNFKKTDYNDQQWKNACLVCPEGCNDKAPKECCKLPVKEPDGTYNVNGIKAAWGSLQGSRGGVKLSTQQRGQVITKLTSLYKQAGLTGLGPLKASNSQRPGVIWKNGVHHVFVNDQPASVSVPKDTIQQTYDVFQDEINKNGGITLGIDHIPEELLEKYPILAKLNPLDVGQITEIDTDGESIYALKSEHTNPLVAELYQNGELPAYSIVADSKFRPCPTGQVDYVLDRMENIKRTDYVDEGGCRECKTGMQPDDTIMTAKLSIKEEANNMGEIDETHTGAGNPAGGNKPTEPDDENHIEAKKNQGSNQGNQTQGNGGSSSGGNQGNNDPNATTQECPVCGEVCGSSDRYCKRCGNTLTSSNNSQSSNQSSNDNGTSPDDSNNGDMNAGNSQMEARLAQLEKDNKIAKEETKNAKLEAKKARYGVIFDAAVKAGKALPADKDALVNDVISKELSEDDFKKIMAKRPVVVDTQQLSRHIEAKNGNKPQRITIENMRAQRKARRF